jgi:signal transduction histidine kinase
MPPSSPAPDARLLRRVRWQLVAWSGLAVLAVLLALGVALYLVVSSSLAASSEQVLRARAEQIARSREPLQRAALGYRLGARGSDTLAVVVDPNDELVGLEGLQLAHGLPDRPSIAAARLGRVDVRTASVTSTDPATGEPTAVPIRVASHPVTRRGGTFVVQVIQSRAAEVETLDTFLSVLGIGALLALVASLLAGAAYAGRALVPIRDALRRQREFAADASHELRTPLTVVRGNVELVRRRVADDPTSAALLDDVDAEVTQLAALVDDLLLLARTDSGAVQIAASSLDLADVALDALPSLSGLAEPRDVRLELDAAPAPVVRWGGTPGCESDRMQGLYILFRMLVTVAMWSKRPPPLPPPPPPRRGHERTPPGSRSAYPLPIPDRQLPPS